MLGVEMSEQSDASRCKQAGYWPCWASPSQQGRKQQHGEQESRDMGDNIKTLAHSLRDECKEVEKRTRALIDHPVFRGDQAFANQHDEMQAQVMLAVRHLEDARMRLGKVCQYAGDGVSIYDKA